MCKVSVTEFRKNLSFYLKKSENEDIFITRNNEIISVLCNPETKAIDSLLALRGCLKEYDDGRPYEELLAEAIDERNMKSF